MLLEKDLVALFGRDLYFSRQGQQLENDPTDDTTHTNTKKSLLILKTTEAPDYRGQRKQRSYFLLTNIVAIVFLDEQMNSGNKSLVGTLMTMNDHVTIISKIQLVVYYQCCVLIG